VPVPGRGDVAARELGQQGFQVFRPRLVVKHTKVEHIETDLFPGYHFVSFRLSDPWGAVRHTRGVRMVLTGPDLRPFTMPPAAMQDLLDEPTRWAPGTRDEPVDLTGSVVEMLDDPFRELRGPVILSGPERVTVLLQLFGRQTPVTADRASVRVQG
jgi:transcription antitermination factor NusG